MEVIFGNPTREDLSNWSWEDHGQPVYSAHLGQTPIGSGAEPIENADGTWGTNVYLEYADCTVYVTGSGFLVIEFYQGDPSGNPEAGEIILYYYMQCNSILEARARAVEIMSSEGRVFDTRYFVIHQFKLEVV
jgi:hypothetical protein